MPVPVVTVSISGSGHSVSYPASDLSPTKTVYLLATSSLSASSWEWSIIPTGSDLRGGYPADSTAWSGANCDFTNGLSTFQNPSCSLDVTGGYCFSARASGSGGWSDPGYFGDGTGSQAIVYILSDTGIKLPPENMYRYADDLNDAIYQISLNSGSLALGVIPTTASLAADVTKTVSANYGDITNLSGSITTISDEYVTVSCAGWVFQGYSSADLLVRILVDGAQYPVAGDRIATVGHAVNFYAHSVAFSMVVGPLSAGTHTIKLQARAISLDAVFKAGYKLDILQYRGGNATTGSIVQLDGTKVGDGITTLNFTGSGWSVISGSQANSVYVNYTGSSQYTKVFKTSDETIVGDATWRAIAGLSASIVPYNGAIDAGYKIFIKPAGAYLTPGVGYSLDGGASVTSSAINAIAGAGWNYSFDGSELLTGLPTGSATTLSWYMISDGNISVRGGGTEHGGKFVASSSIWLRAF